MNSKEDHFRSKCGYWNRIKITRLLSVFTGVIESILFEIQTLHTDAYEYTRDDDFINGLPDYYLKLQENIPPSLSKMATIEVTEDGMRSIVNLKTFTPGSIIAFR